MLQDDEDDQELGAAALVRGGVVAYVLDVERILVLERVDGHVLGAVVLEGAPDLGRAADDEQVADEDHDANAALRRGAAGAPGPARAAACVAAPARKSGRSTNKTDGQPSVTISVRAMCPAAQLLAFALGLDRARAHQPARADDERFVQQHDAAEERRARKSAAMQDGVELARARRRSSRRGGAGPRRCANRPRMRTPSSSA